MLADGHKRKDLHLPNAENLTQRGISDHQEKEYIFSETKLKVFLSDKESTVENNGWVSMIKYDPEAIYKINSISNNQWKKVLANLREVKGKRSGVSKRDLLSTFGEIPYFNPMPSPVIRGTVARSLYENLKENDLTVTDLIRYSPHEYYWLYLYAVSCMKVEIAQAKPHSVHIRDFEQLKKFCRIWINNEREKSYLNSVTLAEKNMPLNLDQKRLLTDILLKSY
jgi:hypothetical protein